MKEVKLKRGVLSTSKTSESSPCWMFTDLSTQLLVAFFARSSNQIQISSGFLIDVTIRTVLNTQPKKISLR